MYRWPQPWGPDLNSVYLGFFVRSRIARMSPLGLGPGFRVYNICIKYCRLPQPWGLNAHPMTLNA